jgi:hypothetical protein
LLLIKHTSIITQEQEKVSIIAVILCSNGCFQLQVEAVAGVLGVALRLGTDKGCKCKNSKNAQFLHGNREWALARVANARTARMHSSFMVTAMIAA